MLFLISLSLVLIGGSLSQDLCPDIESMKNFDFERYAQSKWYEIGRYEFYQEKGADCVAFEYSKEGSETIVTIKEVINKETNVKYRWSVTMAPDAGNNAKLLFTNDKIDETNKTLFVLDTDYDNYVVLYSCTLDNNVKKEMAWVSSRTPTMSPEVAEKVKKVIETHPYVDEKKMVFDNFTPENCLMDV